MVLCWYPTIVSYAVVVEIVTPYKIHRHAIGLFSPLQYDMDKYPHESVVVTIGVSGGQTPLEE